MNSPTTATIAIMRVFVKLRDLTASHKEMREKITELEKKYDEQFQVVFDAIERLMTPPETPRRRIGFATSDAALIGRASSAAT